MILPTSSDALHLAFGIVAGVVLVALFLFAWEDVRLRGAPRALAGLAAASLALLLLLLAASQLGPVLDGWKPDPQTGLPILAMPDIKPNALLPALRHFVSATAFWAALLGGIVAALLVLMTRADSAEEEAEIEAADMPGELAMGAAAEPVFEGG